LGDEPTASIHTHPRHHPHHNPCFYVYCLSNLHLSQYFWLSSVCHVRQLRGPCCTTITTAATTAAAATAAATETSPSHRVLSPLHIRQHCLFYCLWHVWWSFAHPYSYPCPCMGPFSHHCPCTCPYPTCPYPCPCCKRAHPFSPLALSGVHL
jgi:hypothetical protein